MYEKKNKGTLNEEKPSNAEGHKNDKPLENDEMKSVIEEYVANALKSAREDWEKELQTKITAEREDAASLAAMSAEERAKVEMERRQKDFENERQLYMNERAEFEAAKELASQNLPVSFSKMLADPDRDTMLENIEVFKAEYLKAIEGGISQRLKGTLPRISKEKELDGDPFLSGLGM